jgi:hypothetical protein
VFPVTDEHTRPLGENGGVDQIRLVAFDMCRQYKFYSASFEFELRSDNLPDFRVGLAVRIQLDTDASIQEEEEEPVSEEGQEHSSILMYK